jgi:hypothetical protein
MQYLRIIMKPRWLIYILLAATILSLAAMPGCVKRRNYYRTRQMGARSVEQSFDNNRDRLLSIPGVVGAGIAKFDGKPSIVVMVKERTPELETQVPTDLDGYSVIILVTGDIKPQSDTL